MRQCAFLTMDNLDNFECYDSMLYEPLAELGWRVHPISWREKSVDWNDYEIVVIRSTWDYQDEPELFMDVLEKIESSAASLQNPLELVKWNIDKKYLLDLEKNGIQIVPSIFAEQFDQKLCMDAFLKFGCREIVMKPTISANADDTFRFDEKSADIKVLESCFQNREFLIQPFMEDIVLEGEYSLFFFGGDYSHTILKTPKDDDFRVQEEHGGFLQLVVPEPSLLHLAQKTMATLVPSPLYGRIDFVRSKNTFLVMELELIEPSLYFNMDENSPIRFANAFVTFVKKFK